MVGETGVEPARHCWQRILSPWRLPIPPLPHIRKNFLNLYKYYNIFFLKCQIFSEEETRLIFFCPLGLTASLSPHMWWGERGFEPA